MLTYIIIIIMFYAVDYDVVVCACSTLKYYGKL